MNELALFAGAGGGILGGKLLGWRTVCAVEIDRYCRRVLMQRQNDGMLDPFPIWDDVRTFSGREWRGKVDVVSGGFPCQDIAICGKGEGLDGERSGLWGEMARIIREVGPKFAFVENSPAITSRGLGRVLGDLAEMGFDARWGVYGADELAGPIERKRMFIAATIPNRINGQARMGSVENRSATLFARETRKRLGIWLQAPSNGSRMGNGVADYLERVRAIGNGQVPIVAATAWRLLTEGIK